MKIKFTGKSDYNFTKNKIYQLVKCEHTFYQFKTLLSNNNGEIVYIPYSSIEAFNENWRIINE